MECTKGVSPDGSDDAPGSTARPWRTLEHAFTELRPGDVLCVAAGRYEAPRLTVPPGEPDRPIVVQPAGPERPEVRGDALIEDPDHWVLRGLLWRNPGDGDPVLTLHAGTGWVFEDNVVTDGDYAGVLVGRTDDDGSPQDHVLRGNVIHGTEASNLYYNPGRDSRGGVIERNLLFDSGTNNLKLGWGGSDVCDRDNLEDFGVGEVTVRYNTLHGAEQPLVVAEPGGELPVRVERNLITGPTGTYLVRVDDVEGCLEDEVRIVDNLGDGGEQFLEDFGDAPEVVARADGNVHPHDPLFDSTDGPDGFHPRDERAQGYGRYAP